MDSETGNDLGRSMAVIGLLLVLIAWNIPSISGMMTTGMENRFRFSRLRDRLSNLTAGLDMPGTPRADFSYGNDLELGTGVPLDEVELFQVLTSRRHPTGIPFYWKSQVMIITKMGNGRIQLPKSMKFNHLNGRSAS